MNKLFLGLIFISSSLVAQDCIKDRKALDVIRKDITILSDNKMEGRETGTKGEKMALMFLHKRFERIGLETSIHRFTFNGNVIIEFNKELLDLGFYPTQYSSDAVIENTELIDVDFGIEATDLDYSDYSNVDVKGKIVIINTSSPDGIHPHSKYLNYHDLKLRSETAKEKGAIGVVFYTDNKYAETPENKFKNIISTGIPVLFWNNTRENLPSENISFQLKMIEKEVTGHNLIAEIDNGMKHTVLIGAHYDHLGWGKEGSLYRGDSAIHNGADDNASGTAALLYLAKYYSKSEYNKYNYVFIAFSGEEKGLLGSNAYSKSDIFNPEDINYMINMDMIGRLNKENNIEVYGVGTSPVWDKVLERNLCGTINIEKSLSGVGSSDHTSFYLQDIPVLHFFTGTHEDYHKPSDDADKINYKGIITIMSYITSIINDLDDNKKLQFTKTKIEESKKAPKFSVTLGVVPNYMYSDGGMKIDGVNDSKAADKAGMQKGDIVIKLGEVNITDMSSYMKALGHFVKGDQVKAIVIRENKEVELNVKF